MKKQTAGRYALTCGVFASALLAITNGKLDTNHATPQSSADLPRRQDSERPAAFASNAVAAAFAMEPLATFAEVTERPLFAPDRRPHKAPAPIVALDKPIVIAGIVIQPEGRYALIRDGGSKAVRVAEGDRIASGTIKRIMPDRIEIALANDGEAIVKLFAPATAKPGSDDHPAPPSAAPSTPRTQRPVARSGPPRPDGGVGNDTEPPNDAPPRSG